MKLTNKPCRANRYSKHAAHVVAKHFANVNSTSRNVASSLPLAPNRSHSEEIMSRWKRTERTDEREQSRAEQVDRSYVYVPLACAHARRTARCRAPKSRDFSKRFSPNHIFQADWLAPDSGSPRVSPVLSRKSPPLSKREREKEREEGARLQVEPVVYERTRPHARVYVRALRNISPVFHGQKEAESQACSSV